jgi:hypothetical protein
LTAEYYSDQDGEQLYRMPEMWNAISFVSSRLRAETQFATALCALCWEAHDYDMLAQHLTAATLWDDEGFVTSAVTRHWGLLRHASPRLRAAQPV